MEITVTLASECHWLAKTDANQNHVIRCLETYSVHQIVREAIKCWNIDFIVTENTEDHEFVLTIAHVNGKSFHYRPLSDETITHLKKGGRAFLQLQFSTKKKAIEFHRKLKSQLNVLSRTPNIETSLEMLCADFIDSSTILQPETLDVFKKLRYYTQDPLIAKELIRLDAFELISIYAYSSIFQHPFANDLGIKDETKLSNTSLTDPDKKQSTIRNTLKKCPSLRNCTSALRRAEFKGSMSHLEYFSPPSIEGQEETLDTNKTNIVECTSYLLESMAALVTVDIDILGSDPEKLGYQISRFLETDENYYWKLSPTITESCATILTAIATIIRQRNCKVPNRTNDKNPWFKVENLLALDKRQPRASMVLIKCFNNIYSLSDDDMRSKMFQSISTATLRGKNGMQGTNNFHFHHSYTYKINVSYNYLLFTLHTFIF